MCILYSPCVYYTADGPFYLPSLSTHYIHTWEGQIQFLSYHWGQAKPLVSYQYLHDAMVMQCVQVCLAIYLNLKWAVKATYVGKVWKLSLSSRDLVGLLLSCCRGNCKSKSRNAFINAWNVNCSSTGNCKILSNCCRHSLIKCIDKYWKLQVKSSQYLHYCDVLRKTHIQ